MSRRFIVPVEPASGGDVVVVVEVQQEGSRPLDVRLVGCEGESPYVTHIKHGDIGSLKKKFKGSDDDWEAVLSHFLLHQLPGGHAKAVENVHLAYTLRNNTIELSIQQHVKGIKVTLGEISLPIDEEFELDPLEWSRISAQNHLRTLQELADLKTRASGEQDTISKLKAQLDDFIKTKDETERAMLQQFMELLNEKKRKIRDQSRLLAGAQVDETRASKVKVARETTKPRKATASRTSKRKAGANEMEVDEEDDSGPGAATPDRLSDEQTEEEEEDEDEDVAVPPKRELPFGRRATRSKTQTPAAKPRPAPADDDDDDDETEEEEL
ncbi:hypothetical protein P280DRAFT_469451 [Massarina eburnea CBS 473.64]|uniref:DNA double-strand break repair and VJ recombination XRCC4 n=1 Tax=Massarina eburnea CBS 473.64 TaxID=1395130 RepID=A0A6A6RYX7_9PLEO|nr:hypothetical protein P280DRAFT_469451 [Massarina eburnea CBS 473.64]